jgi:MFS family permease
MKKRHPLINTLINLKGNPRACVYTEPLWGIPYNLYAPYTSLYMYALGVKDTQIGFIISIGLALQMVFALLSGAVTDKMGRRNTTFIFDIISWSIPTLIWAFAHNFTYFLIAAIVNSVWRLTGNSWSCLMVEDSEPGTLVGIYSWVHISGLIAAFFAPLSSLFVMRNGLVPTVRILYLVAFGFMTVKFIILYVFSTETRQGAVRMRETRDQSIFRILSQYGGVLKQILHSKATLASVGIMLVMSIFNTVNGTFWSLLITGRVGIPEEVVALFPFLRSIIMLALFFVLIPRIKTANFKRPLLIGFIIRSASQLLLISAPANGYAFIIISTILEAFALALINPLMDSLVAVSVDPKERARIMSIIYVTVIAVTSPFGWIAGILSEINRILPFVMNIGLFVIGCTLTYLSSSSSRRKADAAA